jgi:UDP-glucose 4-epimerase
MSSDTVVLVTGGGGFIGSHLVDRLCRDGYRVRVLDNFATGRRENLLHLMDEIELVEGDIQSYERVHNAIRGADLVFHAAALPSVPRSVQDPLTSNASNITGTLNVLLAARDEGVRRVIFASSSSIYGANSELPKREDMPVLPVAPYAVAKLAAEGYCRAFFEVYGLETVSLRYFNVFGPRQDPLSQYAAVIPSFITAFLEERRPVVYGDGEQSRDFTYVDNIVGASLLAAEAPGVGGKTFNIACGERTSLNALLEILGTLCGRQAEASYTAPRPGDVPHSLAEISRAREALGYEPEIDVRRGLELTYQHLEEGATNGRPPLAGPLHAGSPLGPSR